MIMAYGCFSDRADRPSPGRAEEALGAARPLWADLVAFVEAGWRTRSAWRFYGRNYGWALAYKRSGKALAAFFPDKGRLTALVVLTGRQADAALVDAQLSAATRELIASLPRFKEGCWVFVPVTAAGGSADARRLIEIRAEG